MKLAIADDHKLFAGSLAEILKQRYGMEVLWLSNDGAAFLERLAQHPVKPDVVLLDIQMYPVNGIQVLKEIKTHYPSLPVLMITMEDNAEKLEEAFTAGAAGLILKSGDMSELAMAIQSVHEKGMYLSEFTAQVLMGAARNK